MNLREFHSAGSVEELISLLNSFPDAVLHAGGTDIVTALKSGKLKAGRIIDLSRIPELKNIENNDNGDIVIGAGASLSQVENHPDFRNVSVLTSAVNVIGSRQIRNRGTLVGNVCNASPAADTLPALTVLESELILTGAAGSRIVPVTEFITAPGKTVLNKGEFVSAIKIPVTCKAGFSAFERLGRREAVELATVSAACLITPDDRFRISAGAVSPVPLRYKELESVLAEEYRKNGASMDIKKIVEIPNLLNVNPITDIRADKEYRIAMIKVLVRRSVESAIKKREAE